MEGGGWKRNAEGIPLRHRFAPKTSGSTRENALLFLQLSTRTVHYAVDDFALVKRLACNQNPDKEREGKGEKNDESRHTEDADNPAKHGDALQN
jgi:hypothetical protein